MTTTRGGLVGTANPRNRLEATLVQRAKFVAEYRQSGLTMAAYARREGLAYSSFASWVLKSVRPSGRPLPAVRFAEVELPLTRSATSAGLEVRLSDGTLLRGGRVDELAALTRALRE